MEQEWHVVSVSRAEEYTSAGCLYCAASLALAHALIGMGGSLELIVTENGPTRHVQGVSPNPPKME